MCLRLRVWVAGQRIQLKASLEGVTFAPAPDSAPSSSSGQDLPQAAVQPTQPGKIDKVSHVPLYLSHLTCM